MPYYHECLGWGVERDGKKKKKKNDSGEKRVEVKRQKESINLQTHALLSFLIFFFFCNQTQGKKGLECRLL